MNKKIIGLFAAATLAVLLLCSPFAQADGALSGSYYRYPLNADTEVYVNAFDIGDMWVIQRADQHTEDSLMIETRINQAILAAKQFLANNPLSLHLQDGPIYDLSFKDGFHFERADGPSKRMGVFSKSDLDHDPAELLAQYIGSGYEVSDRVRRSFSSLHWSDGGINHGLLGGTTDLSNGVNLEPDHPTVIKKEESYRANANIALNDQLVMSPTIQYVKNPVYGPDDTEVYVFGIQFHYSR